MAAREKGDSGKVVQVHKTGEVDEEEHHPEITLLHTLLHLSSRLGTERAAVAAALGSAPASPSA